MTPAASLPLWGEAIVAALLLASAVFVLAAAWGVARLREYFQRMHPPALISVWGAWCVTLASIVYFSLLDARLELHVWLIIILLSITSPITTILLARAALFRGRQRGQPLPPRLQPMTACAAGDETAAANPAQQQ